MYFNYLVDIPKHIKNNSIKEEIIEEPEEEVEEPKKNINFKLKQPVKKSVEKPIKEVENLVYSNYVKKQNNENINIDIQDLMLYNSIENIDDDEDDDDNDDEDVDDNSECNLTDTTFGNDESDPEQFF